MKNKYSVLDLFYYNSIRYITICNLVLWSVSGFSFYGIFLNIEGMTGNIYLDAVVSYSAEFIAELLSGHLATVFGRRIVLFQSFLMATLGCIFYILFADIKSIQTIMLFMSAMGISSAFNVLYIYSAELFPTNIKSLALSSFSLSNRLTAGCVPILLTFTTEIIPIIGVLSLICTLIMLYLPESMNYNAGDEIEELQGQIMLDISQETYNLYLNDLDKSN